ncbi:hypothetical protein ONZ45_g10389 [Pleurotus djamor]|nr:hypothetical protein ONZ45_g10389 [Pleurotus djamor]
MFLIQPLSNPENSHRYIDRDIRDPENKIRALKTSRNRRSFVGQLPDEVLSIIFIVRRDDSLESSSTTWKLDWLNISAVCRHWREVSLATPLLWSFIDFKSVNCAEEMMERSKATPLSLRIVFAGDSCDDGRRELALDALSNRSVREIDIQSPDHKQTLRLLELLPYQSVPLLQSIKLTRLTFDEDNEENEETDEVDDSRQWPSQDMPSVRRLELTRVPIPTHFYRTSNLKYLKIDPPIRISVEETLDLLRNTSCIEEFSVVALYSCPSYIPQRYIKGVSLPCLKVLEVDACDALSARILHHLTFPPSASVYLSLCPDPSTPPSTDSFLAIVNVWSRFAANLTSPPMVEVPELDADLSVNRTEQNFYIKVSQNFFEDTPILHLDYPLLFESSIPSLIQAVSSRVTTLSLYSLEKTDVWINFLPLFEEIQCFTLAKCHLTILDLLRSSSSARRDLLFPKLTILTLSDYTVEDGACIAFHTSPSGHFGLLLDLCKVRVIESVIVTGTTTTQGVMDHFRCNGVHVEWINVKIARADGLDVESDLKEDHNEDEDESN